MHRNEPNEHLLKRRLTQIFADYEKAAPCLRTFLFFAKICVNLRFNTYLLKYQLIHNRVGMN